MTDCSPRYIASLKRNQGTEQYALIYVKHKTKERKHTYICIHEYVYICIHICIYINVYTHTNTHTNTMLVDSSLCKDSEAGNKDCLWGLTSEIRKLLHNLPFAAFYKNIFIKHITFSRTAHACTHTHTELENIGSL